MAVKQIFAGVEVGRRVGFGVQRAESRELLSGPDAVRDPVAPLQIKSGSHYGQGPASHHSGTLGMRHHEDRRGTLTQRLMSAA